MACIYTHESDRCKNRRGRVASPFCSVTFRGKRPQNPAYPQQLTSYGDHIRAKRLDLRLNQRAVAKRIGVTTQSITNWELNRTSPETPFAYSGQDEHRFRKREQ